MTSIANIAKRLRDNDSSLTNLTLNSAKINFDEVGVISGSLARNKFLQVMDFSNNFIGPAGIQSLAKSLERNISLHTLYLRSSNAENEGAETLANLLKIKNTSLRNLYLGNSNIGPSGVSALANILKFNTTLEVLSFRNNEVGNEGANALATNLEVNTTLKTLNLSNTEIEDEGAISLLETLDVNTNILDIKLNYNEIDDDEILEKINASLHYNNSQNVIAVNNVARKILSYCGEHLYQKDLGEKRTISSQDLDKKHALSKEDLYHLSSKNSHGGAILCLASLSRMILHKYNPGSLNLILQTAYNLCAILFSCAKSELSNQAIEKPNEKIITIAVAALDKIN